VNADELSAFLDRPLLGVVSTLRRDGSPHAVPVWFRYDGETVRIWTDERRGWVRNLRRDPRVAFAVAEMDPPYAGVILRGEGTVRTSADEATAAEIRAITRRYIPEGEVEEYVARWPHLNTIVTIRPSAVTGWIVGY
jgi:PPOX class probable F420-dependent enzyme